MFAISDTKYAMSFVRWKWCTRRLSWGKMCRLVFFT